MSATTYSTPSTVHLRLASAPIVNARVFSRAPHRLDSTRLIPNGTPTGRPPRACLASPQSSPRYASAAQIGRAAQTRAAPKAPRPEHLLDRYEPSLAGITWIIQQ